MFTLFAIVLYFLARRFIKEFSKKLLPSFCEVDNSFDEYIFISEIKKQAAEIKPVIVKPIAEKFSGYIPPKREIISPEIFYMPVIKEIITPAENETD